jgi:hypothetical protein
VDVLTLADTNFYGASKSAGRKVQSLCSRELQQRRPWKVTWMSEHEVYALMIRVGMFLLAEFLVFLLL